MLAASMTRFCSCVLPCALLLGTPLATWGAPLSEENKSTQVDFERHLMGLFGRMGCNSGSCHGSFQGKGGFRLSLFGYDPEKDYLAITREVQGRRINPADPDRSLLLLKATGQVDHGGGRRFSNDSWQYRLFRDWIAAGARWQKGKGNVAAITISPPEYAFKKAGEAGHLAVKARFGDGSEEDITTFCDFRTNDDAVADVTNVGQVSVLRPGDTSIVVSYRGNVLSVRVMVPMEAPPGFRYPRVPEVNYIDREVFAKLRRLNIVPSDLSEDAEFLRRVTIDTIGSLPSPDEVRAFLADPDPGKRVKKIDSLLAHPLHAAVWATKFCDITGNNTDQLENPPQFKARRSQMWHDWFRKRLTDNMPYDEIVRGILSATSRDGQPPEEWIKRANTQDEALEKGFVSTYAEKPTLDLFWRRLQQNVPVETWGEKTAAAFLGVRLECAQCHKHPFDRWTQVDYRAYANVFSLVAVNASPEAKKLIDDENAARNKKNTNRNQVIQVREVYVANAGRGVGPRLTHPDTNRPLPPRTLGGPEVALESGKDPRLALYEWMRSPDNPFFARSFVNRVWAHYFGVGIVDPPDNFSLANPPSNEKLLDALAKDFIEHNYDLRQLERTILGSRAYQLSFRTNATNRLDRNNYSHAYTRPMMAEVVVDVLNTALASSENFNNDAPAGSRAIEVGASRVTNQTVNYCFRIFGRSPRTAACDCERAMEPALPQKLFLMADPNVIAKLKAPGGRVRQLAAGNLTDDQLVEELYLATLSRLPTDEEKKVVSEYREEKKDRVAFVTDLTWALINTREFVLNH